MKENVQEATLVEEAEAVNAEQEQPEEPALHPQTGQVALRWWKILDIDVNVLLKS